MSEDQILERVRNGQHTVTTGEVEIPAALFVLPVHCDLPGPPLVPLVELCARIETLLGDVRVPDSGVTRRRFAGRRSPHRMYPGRLANTLNRLAASTTGNAAVWFHAFEHIDAASREMLIACVSEPGWVQLPLVFALEEPGELSDRLAGVIGAEGVIEGAAPGSAELPQLPDDVLMALRAAATAGDAFEVETVAELLLEDPVAVLEQLQIARDRGVAVRDRGGGILALPAPLAGSLRAGLLPSLRQAWNGLLAVAHGTPIVSTGAGDDELVPLAINAASLPPLPELEPLFGAVEVEYLETAESIIESAAEIAAGSSPPRAPARAIRHAVEAGQIEDAIEHMLAVAQRATEAGAFVEALELVEGAEAEAGRLPPSQRITELRARAELERGTIAWVAVGNPGDADTTLARALEHLERALELSGGRDLQLEAEIRATMAGVCFDLGDRASLERAIELLTEASRSLAEVGLAIEAAQLLNEQASVWVRLGDPVKAYGLLQTSRRVFEQLVGPDAILEIAGTDHQTARLVLHTEAQPQTIDFGIALARRATEIYEHFGLHGEAAWARETAGRLALRGHRFEVAEAELREAFESQLGLGDGNGLARTTAALADLAAERGAPADALEALAESVALNIAKGSPIGLAFNLESLERIDPELELPGAAELAERIHSAQSNVGVVDSPGAMLRPEA